MIPKQSHHQIPSLDDRKQFSGCLLPTVLYTNNAPPEVKILKKKIKYGSGQERSVILDKYLKININITT